MDKFKGKPDAVITCRNAVSADPPPAATADILVYMEELIGRVEILESQMASFNQLLNDVEMKSPQADGNGEEYSQFY